MDTHIQLLIHLNPDTQEIESVKTQDLGRGLPPTHRIQMPRSLFDDYVDSVIEYEDDPDAPDAKYKMDCARRNYHYIIRSICKKQDADKPAKHVDDYTPEQLENLGRSKIRMNGFRDSSLRDYNTNANEDV